MSQAKHIEVKLKGPSTFRIDGGAGKPSGCQAPASVKIIVNAVQANATISWDAVIGAAQYEYRLRIAGTNTWLQPAPTALTISLFSPIVAEQAYEFQIRTICTGGKTSGWASFPFDTFSPAPAIPQFDYILPVIFAQ